MAPKVELPQDSSAFNSYPANLGGGARKSHGSLAIDRGGVRMVLTPYAERCGHPAARRM
jgi:hypothetical protein